MNLGPLVLLLLGCKSPASVQPVSAQGLRFDLSSQVGPDGSEQPLWQASVTADEIVALVGEVALDDCSRLLDANTWETCSASVGDCVRVIIRSGGRHRIEILPRQCSGSTADGHWLMSRGGRDGDLAAMPMRSSSEEPLDVRVITLETTP